MVAHWLYDCLWLISPPHGHIKELNQAFLITLQAVGTEHVQAGEVFCKRQGQNLTGSTVSDHKEAFLWLLDLLSYVAPHPQRDCSEHERNTRAKTMTAQSELDIVQYPTT
ncbi:hypothetical protein RRG08_058852 [Elysia crispata]|uniref:Uncharacterized protein n=1 Tax=Elysia crispata TaxID=231223 RepID=A0AAE0XZG8_9GAST|nr:hypothetical protein RRG08_058852 [Elysia crispata]